MKHYVKFKREECQTCSGLRASLTYQHISIYGLHKAGGYWKSSNKVREYATKGCRGCVQVQLLSSLVGFYSLLLSLHIINAERHIRDNDGWMDPSMMGLSASECVVVNVLTSRFYENLLVKMLAGKAEKKYG